MAELSVARGDGAAAVEELKRLPGRALVVFGGVQTVSSLVGASVVDEFWVKVNPVAIGRGGPVFAGLENPAQLAVLRSPWLWLVQAARRDWRGLCLPPWPSLVMKGSAVRIRASASRLT